MTVFSSSRLVLDAPDRIAPPVAEVNSATQTWTGLGPRPDSGDSKTSSASTPSLNTSTPDVGLTPTTSLEELLSRSDHLTVTTPYTPTLRSRRSDCEVPLSMSTVTFVAIQPTVPGLVKTSTVAAADSASTTSPDGLRSWILKFFSTNVVDRMSILRCDTVTPALKPTLPLAPANSTPHTADNNNTVFMCHRLDTRVASAYQSWYQKEIQN